MVALMLFTVIAFLIAAPVAITDFKLGVVILLCGVMLDDVVFA